MRRTRPLPHEEQIREGLLQRIKQRAGRGDGWKWNKKALAARAAGRTGEELAVLLDGVAHGVDTPYTYDRAALLLEKADDRIERWRSGRAWGRRIWSPQASQSRDEDHEAADEARGQDRQRPLGRRYGGWPRGRHSPHSRQHMVTNLDQRGPGVSP